MPPRRSGARAEQTEALAEPAGQLRGAEHGHPCRRELDGQRHAVQPAADLRRRGRLVTVVVGGVYRAGAIGEQLHGRPRVVGGGQRKGCHEPAVLAVHGEGLAAGGQHRDARALGDEPIGQAPGCLDEVFAVVQHEQQAAVVQCRDDAVLGCAAGLRDPERGRDGGWYRVGLGDRRELAEPGPVRVAGLASRGDRQGEPGLANAAHPGQREQPRLRVGPRSPRPRRPRGPRSS